MQDWLGSEYVHTHHRQYKSFSEAKEWARTSEIKTQQQWHDYRKAGKLPSDIPGDPRNVYKNKGWRSMQDWLGTENI